MNLQRLLSLAENSPVYRWLLNRALNVAIPFNKPHRFKVLEVSDQKIKVRLPYRRSNFNHIGGIHACALATVSEFATGLLLVKRLDGKRYRLIMQRMEMDYHYQGKMDAVATFEIDDKWLNEAIVEPVAESGVALVQCVVLIHDVQGNHLTSGRIHWQIKDWRKVKTKVS